MNNEVSKLGQPEEPEEVIEGRIVSPYDGPLMTDDVWKYLRQAHLYGSYHFVADADGIHDGDTVMSPGGWAVPKDQHYDTGNTYKTGRMYVAPVDDPTDWTEVGSAGVTFERGPSFTEGWWDEVKDWKPEPVRVEFSSGDISDETFRLMTGYDRNVLIAATKLGTQTPVPPVDPDRVKWPS